MESSVLGCETGVEVEKSVGMSGYCDGKEYSVLIFGDLLIIF